MDKEPEIDNAGSLVPLPSAQGPAAASTAAAVAVAVEAAAAVPLTSSVSVTVFPLLRQVRRPFFGRIDLVNVCFAYPSRPQVMVLNNFNLTLRPGEVEVV
jgi:ATP-binding cassette subfamily B protein